MRLPFGFYNFSNWRPRFNMFWIHPCNVCYYCDVAKWLLRKIFGKSTSNDNVDNIHEVTSCRGQPTRFFAVGSFGQLCIYSKFFGKEGQSLRVVWVRPNSGQTTTWTWPGLSGLCIRGWPYWKRLSSSFTHDPSFHCIPNGKVKMFIQSLITWLGKLDYAKVSLWVAHKVTCTRIKKCVNKIRKNERSKAQCINKTHSNLSLLFMQKAFFFLRDCGLTNTLEFVVCSDNKPRLTLKMWPGPYPLSRTCISI